ncbi:hypothetical protein HYALB_00009923 [Hymenoscyphus albidus]|uniref:BTB domain-containing protein n=1 Tax=Hymenoscyphus albidus TaxID=595503 RepID=A0A9N9Q626_9HELO|nr:hypothetical protein HYALB_00009923 [Hymenoscyphus albidus]
MSHDKVFDPDGDVTLILPGNLDEFGIPIESMGGKSQKSNVRMIVSSKHLTLASEVFKAMLSSNFQEGITLRSVGSVTFNLPDDEPIAFEILMNMVHGKFRLVPAKVTLANVTSLAVLVDKYRLQEVAEVMTKRWLEQHEAWDDFCKKSELTNDHLCYMKIFSVFEREDALQEIMMRIGLIAKNAAFQDNFGKEFYEILPVSVKAIH